MQAPGRVFSAALTAALVVQSGMHAWFIAEHSATFDEPVFIAAGLEYASTGKDAKVFCHPPLAKRIAGFAALSAGADPADLGTDPAGIPLLFEPDRDRAAAVLRRARWATTAGAMLLTVVVSLAAYTFWGEPAGILAALLMAVEPDLLAHGSLVTTDLWLTLFMTIFAVQLIPAVSGTATGRFREWLGIWAGLALASKFSGVGFLPAVAVGVGLGLGRTEGYRATFSRLLHAAPRIAAVAGLVVLAVYSIHVRLVPPGTGSGGWPAVGPVAIAGEVNYYLPMGLRWAARYASEGAPAFFHGSLRTGMVPEYFPAVLLLKIPLAVFGLIAAAVWFGGLRGPRGAVLLGAAGLVASVLTTRLHIGLRHVLPVIPLLILAAASLLDDALPRRRLRYALALTGFLWAAGSTLRCAPHFLAHFNELAGGPAGGWRWFSDSSIDWGQDLPALKRWMNANEVKELPLYYFGRADPSFHGIGVAQEGPETPGWKGGFVAISVSYLNGTTTGTLDRFAWARSLTPVATPGWSIHVFEVPTSPSRPSSSRTR